MSKTHERMIAPPRQLLTNTTPASKATATD